MTDRPTRERLAEIWAYNVGQRNAGGPWPFARDAIADLLAEIDALTAERDALTEDATLWREQQAEIEHDWDRADADLAANAAVRALPESERRAAIVAGAGLIWTDEEHARTREVAATMPVFVRVCQEKREAVARAEQAEAELADVRQRCGGYPDSRVDGDGGIVAVVVRERDEARAHLAELQEAAANVLAYPVGHGAGAQYRASLKRLRSVTAASVATPRPPKS